MPEGRRIPWKFLPKLGTRLSVTIGQPIDHSKIQKTLDKSSRERFLLSRTESLQPTKVGLQDLASHSPVKNTLKQETDNVRSEVTALLQSAVENLGNCLRNQTNLDKV